MYGHRARIGYTSPPATTEVFPYEFYKIVPDGVTLVITTLAIMKLTSDEVDQSYEISLRAAGQMAEAGIDLMVLGGVPINISRGIDKVEDLVRDTEKKIGVPVTTSLNAQMNGLKAVGAKKVAIIHPFDTESETNAPGNMHYDCLSRHGFELTAIKGADRPAIELGRIPSETPLAIARELKEAHPEVDTISFPCPHWAVAELIEPLETELGVNVVTALQTIVWESLRLCGIKDSIGGYGRLLREH
jgi:maleate isomerase